MQVPYRVMYLTGAWLLFVGASPRSATLKLWFKSKAEAVAYGKSLRS